jgi:hypothetical protein
VRRLLAWIGGVLGGIAAWRYLRRRSEAAPPAPPAAEVDPRAEALRAKLDEAREAEPEVEAGPEAPEEQEASSAAEPEPEPEVADPEERRRSVHDHGRAALEEMRAGDGDEASSSS